MVIDSQFIYVLFGLLISLLAWIGARVHTKMDYLTEKIEEKLGEVNHTLRGIERDLRGDLNEHDRRITRIESHISDMEKLKGN
jgi:hypothetical protein